MLPARDGCPALPPAAEFEVVVSAPVAPRDLTRAGRPPVAFCMLVTVSPRFLLRERASASVLICTRTKEDSARAHVESISVFVVAPVIYRKNSGRGKSFNSIRICRLDDSKGPPRIAPGGRCLVTHTSFGCRPANVALGRAMSLGQRAHRIAQARRASDADHALPDRARPDVARIDARSVGRPIGLLSPYLGVLRVRRNG